MARGLRLVESGPSIARLPAPRWAVAGLSACILAAALVATLLGAGSPRRAADPRAAADAVLRLALERGADDPTVRSDLQALRLALGRRPLDSRARVAYAAALAGLATGTGDLDAAAFHAERAARLAPVTVPVVRGAVLVLERSGDIDAALRWLGAMFRYDAGAAARLLLEVEPLVPADRVAEALAASPAAWLAWSRTLARAGRAEDAAAALSAARARWPGDLGLLGEAAARAFGAADFLALGALLPADLALPAERGAGMLHVYRAVLAARSHDPVRARADLARGQALDPGNAWLRIVAGDALDTLGATDEAVSLWNAVQFGAPRSATSTRVSVLRRLARSDERRAQAGAALGHWRELLSLVPDDPEASRRVLALTGAAP